MIESRLPLALAASPAPTRQPEAASNEGQAGSLPRVGNEGNSRSQRGPPGANAQLMKKKHVCLCT